MAEKSIIAICLSGGEFETKEDGELSYKGGDAHAMEVDSKMKLKDFKSEVAEMFNSNTATISVKYFLPDNKKTLISISNEKDFKRMIKFHSKSGTAEIYVMTEESLAPEQLKQPTGSRMNTATFPEMGAPQSFPGLEAAMDASANMLNSAVVDMNENSLMIDATFDVVEDANHEDAETNVIAEMPESNGVPEPLSFVDLRMEPPHAKSTWNGQQTTITGIGQRFKSVNEFREAIREYCAANRFAYKYKKNDGQRVTVTCKSEGCPWRIYASRLSTTPLICIKKMNPTHTCDGLLSRSGYKPTRGWIANIIKEKVKANPEYKPRDIVDDIKQEYGVELKYYQAWRGKEIAVEQLKGSYKEAYGMLPHFCNKIMESNPGSLAAFTTKDDSTFHRLFVSFHACIHGFEQGCRPLLFLDSKFLMSKYQCTFLAAIAADGNNEFFPVAFAVVDAETDDNWLWFLTQLKIALKVSRRLTFVSDREKGLRSSIAEIFQTDEVYHGFCLRSLSEQLVRDLKGQLSNEIKNLVLEDLAGAAYAATSEGFHKHVESIRSSSISAYSWIVQSEPIHWANAFFQGVRYNHLTSDFGDLFYTWAWDARELPITQLVEAIQSKIMALISTRHAMSAQWLARLTPKIEEELEKETLRSRSFQVLMLAGDKFEVRGDTIEVVDINNCDCSCKSWPLTRLPCCHAIAVINGMNRDVYAYYAQYFTSEYYRITYSQPIHQISSTIVARNNGNSESSVKVTPPPTRRPPGRPWKNGIGPIDGRKRRPKCRRCKGIGHNKKSCTEVLLE